MPQKRRLLSLSSWFALVLALVAGPGAPADEAAMPTTPPAHETPQSVEQLRAIQEKVEAAVDRVAPAVVALQVGFGTGSGVVVSEDGLILTAAHVVGEPGRRVTVVFPDGTAALGRSLGVERWRTDAGMIKLDEDGPWPHVEMAEAGTVALGEFVIAMGHPGGFVAQRPRVVRLGRIIRVRPTALQSDSALVGGDSGGPLFDLEGRLIGVHSRIGRSMRSNYHVPIGAYHRNWLALRSGHDMDRRRGRPFIGVIFQPLDDAALIARVLPGTGAAAAGLRRGDRILRADGEPVDRDAILQEIVAESIPGTDLLLQIERDERVFEVEVGVGLAMDR